MPDAPWRCSQCGTLNEPVANACRTCGRWPSLFDLESSTVEPPVPTEGDGGFAARTTDEPEAEPEPEPEIEQPAVEAELPPEFDPAAEGDEPPPRPGWRRFARLIVPVGFVLYLLISAIANRG